jgi:hypothetical protein
MNRTRLRNRLTLALIILAFWITDAAASGSPPCLRGPEGLFHLSIEELMEVPIDHDGSEWAYDRDLAEVPAPAAASAGALHDKNDEGVPFHDAPETSTSMAWDNANYGCNQDEK